MHKYLKYLINNSEKGESKAFTSLLEAIKENLAKHSAELEFFSLLMNSISSLNLCLDEICQILKNQRKLKVFRIWLGYHEKTTKNAKSN